MRTDAETQTSLQAAAKGSQSVSRSKRKAGATEGAAGGNALDQMSLANVPACTHACIGQPVQCLIASDDQATARSSSSNIIIILNGRVSLRPD